MSEPELPTYPASEPSLPPPPPSSDAWGSAPTPERRSRRPLAVVAAILALALIGGCATYAFLRSDEHPSGPSTSLTLAFDRGDETTYDIHMTMDGSVDAGPLGEQPLAMDVNETVGWKVTHVDEDGVATVEVSVTGVSGSANGMPVPADAAERSTTLRVTPDGQIVDGNGLSFGATGGTAFGGFPGMDQVTPILPDGAVAPGDTWDKHFSQTLPFGGGKIEYTAHSTFDRYESLGGVRAAVITTQYTLPLDFSIDLGDVARSLGETGGMPAGVGKDATITYAGSGTFTQTGWLDLQGKQVLKTSSKGDFDMTIGFPGLAAQLGSDQMKMSASFSLEMVRR